MSSIFGKKLKSLREEKRIPQRQLAAVLEIDTATYCKIEKGSRRAKREQVIKLATLLNFNKNELFRLWSADKVYDIIADEDDASQILNIVAENIVAYKRKSTKV
ncbi:MAG: helix-turn-helix domain-containing protein [Bacteroidales bacterium]|nr:helix-turn-helix domain-containing protein [Bacteroidales bacterium]